MFAGLVCSSILVVAMGNGPWHSLGRSRSRLR
jgi:hypothetical protein